MISVDLSNAKTLEEFNKLIISSHEKEHGSGYCDVHLAIKKYSEECESYKEIGVNQGGTASTALLCNFNTVSLIDINLEPYRKYLSHIASNYSKENNIKLIENQISSLDPKSVSESDMLFIDSLHDPSHMKKELLLHGPYTKKYIIAHDTYIINRRVDDSLYDCLCHYAKSFDWDVVENSKSNVGYVVLKNKFVLS